MMAQGNPRCVAQFDYQARDTEELSISKNEHLTVVDGSGSWWKVRNDRGGVGFVPSNYVKELPLLAKPPQPAPVPKVSSVGSASQRTPLNDEPGIMYQQTDLQKQIRNGPSLNIKAVAKFKYASTREDELSLEKGDELIVIEKEADGWWRGRSGTRIGWFPFNYVEELETEQPAQAKPQQPPEKSVICSVVALYAFNSGNPEELVFQKGEQMDIVDQPADDPDWWEACKSDGSSGLIPRNYVEVIHEATPSTGATPRPPINQNVFPGVPPPAAAAAAAVGVRPPPPFAQEPWYHGRIPRKDAEVFLSQYAENGQFLVRESETKVCKVFFVLKCVIIQCLTIH